MDNYGTYNVVNLHPPKDTSAGAFSTAYVDMENWGHVDFVVQCAAKGAGTQAVTLKEAINKSGSSAATMTNTKNYFSNIANAASTSLGNLDGFVKTTLTSGTFNVAASTNNQTYIIPVDAEHLSRTSAMTHIGIGIATTGAASLIGAIAILSEPRYAAETPPTAMG